jgi:hypothetical protein
MHAINTTNTLSPGFTAADYTLCAQVILIQVDVDQIDRVIEAVAGQAQDFVTA